MRIKKRDIFRIPVLGYLIHFVVAVFRLPRNDDLIRKLRQDISVLKQSNNISDSASPALDPHVSSKIDRIDDNLFQLKQRTENNYNLQIQLLYENRKNSHPNPLCRYGMKMYSQSDEDGITFEICKRIGVSKGFFLEFGVGDGLENNTLALLCAGWKGAWFGGQDLAFDPSNSSRLNFSKAWITRENILEYAKSVMRKMQHDTVDLISLDLDGNDYYLIEELLTNGVQPKVFIVEYNAKFLPSIEFNIEYDAKHVWNDDDYYGASLASMNSLFWRFGYRLVCCNSATGSNSFFVKNEFSSKFDDVPNSIEDIYVDLNFNLFNYWGHKPSIKTIDVLIR